MDINQRGGNRRDVAAKVATFTTWFIDFTNEIINEMPWLLVDTELVPINYLDFSLLDLQCLKSAARRRRINFKRHNALANTLWRRFDRWVFDLTLLTALCEIMSRSDRRGVSEISCIINITCRKNLWSLDNRAGWALAGQPRTQRTRLAWRVARSPRYGGRSDSRCILETKVMPRLGTTKQHQAARQKLQWVKKVFVRHHLFAINNLLRPRVAKLLFAACECL